MEVKVNGESSAPRQLPVTAAVNSSTNPAHPGSAVSVFVNGLTQDLQIPSVPLQLYASGWLVTDVSKENPFVLKVIFRFRRRQQLPAERGGLHRGLYAYDINSFTSRSPLGSMAGSAFGGKVYVSKTQ